MVLDPPTAYPHLYPTPASWQVLRQALCQGSDSAALNSPTNHCSESKNRKSSEFMATRMQQSIEEQNHDYNNLWFEGETSSTGTNLFSALAQGYKIDSQGEERVRYMERVTRQFTLLYVMIGEFAVWLRKLKQGLYQSRGVEWGRRWEGGSKGRGYTYTYGWFVLITKFCKAIIP